MASSESKRTTDWERVAWRAVLLLVFVASAIGIVARSQTGAASMDAPLLAATVAAAGLACSARGRP
jgi:hypothetical protein